MLTTWKTPGNAQHANHRGIIGIAIVVKSMFDKHGQHTATGVVAVRVAVVAGTQRESALVIAKPAIISGYSNQCPVICEWHYKATTADEPLQISVLRSGLPCLRLPFKSGSQAQSVLFCCEIFESSLENNVINFSDAIFECERLS